MSYRVPVLENFQWQQPVKSIITASALAALTPAKGDRYIVTDGPNANQIVYCSNATGPVWTYDTALTAGMIVWVDDQNDYYNYSGSAWVKYLGQAGTSGTSGVDGTSGTSGSNGSSGSSGSSGTNGSSGTSGSNG